MWFSVRECLKHVKRWAWGGGTLQEVSTARLGAWKQGGQPCGEKWAETSRRRSERFGGRAGTGRGLCRCSALPSKLLQAFCFYSSERGFWEKVWCNGTFIKPATSVALRTYCRWAKAKASSFYVSNKMKVRQRQTNIRYHHLHVESKKNDKKWTYLRNRNGLTDIKNKHGYQRG